MTDREVREIPNILHAHERLHVTELLHELLAYRRAVRRLKKAWGKFGPVSGQGAVSEAVLDLLAVEER